MYSTHTHTHTQTHTHTHTHTTTKSFEQPLLNLRRVCAELPPNTNNKHAVNGIVTHEQSSFHTFIDLSEGCDVVFHWLSGGFISLWKTNMYSIIRRLDSSNSSVHYYVYLLFLTCCAAPLAAIACLVVLQVRSLSVWGPYLLCSS